MNLLRFLGLSTDIVLFDDDIEGLKKLLILLASNVLFQIENVSIDADGIALFENKQIEILKKYLTPKDNIFEYFGNEIRFLYDATKIFKNKPYDSRLLIIVDALTTYQDFRDNLIKNRKNIESDFNPKSLTNWTDRNQYLTKK